MKVGIIGAGTMGSGIAQAFAQCDEVEKVYLCDMLENCKEEISVENGEIPLNFRAFEIKTVRIKK